LWNIYKVINKGFGKLSTSRRKITAFSLLFILFRSCGGEKTAFTEE
jgi:hypothetical protein